jgi:heterodisulfide reductase subunit C
MQSIKSEDTCTCSAEKMSDSDFYFAASIKKKSKVNTNLCWQCHTCTIGCPFSNLMDIMPHQAIRSIQLGEKRSLLESSTIWLCVGCNACVSECPMGIDMPSVMTALRQTAIQEKVKIASDDIYTFHKEFLNSIKKHGRAYKIGIMLSYKLKKLGLFKDGKAGLRMLAKRKLNILPSKVKNIRDLKKLFV